MPTVTPPLIILLHGVGHTPAAMAPLAERIASRLPDATIAAPPAACPYDLAERGHQWFSVDGITEENRPARIRAALPAFVETVRSLQRAHGATPADTVLAGFSQGAIMALAACTDTWLARHVVAIAGRSQPPRRRLPGRTRRRRPSRPGAARRTHAGAGNRGRRHRGRDAAAAIGINLTFRQRLPHLYAFSVFNAAEFA